MKPNFLAIDFETASFNRDSACALGLVRIENERIVHKSVHLIRPPSSDFMFTHIHGITWLDVAKAPTFKTLWKDIKHLFEGIDFLAAHNASFDASVLRACSARAGLASPEIPFTCTVKLARQQWDLYPTKLPDVCRHLGLKLNHHEALSDALACAQIVMAAHKENGSRVTLPAVKTAKTEKLPAKTRLRAQAENRTV